MSVAEPAPRRWTVDEFYRAAEAGVFGSEERLELIEGEIYRMRPQHPPMRRPWAWWRMPWLPDFPLAM